MAYLLSVLTYWGLPSSPVNTWRKRFIVRDDDVSLYAFNNAEIYSLYLYWTRDWQTATAYHPVYSSSSSSSYYSFWELIFIRLPPPPFYFNKTNK